MPSTIVDTNYNGNYCAWLQDFASRVKQAFPKETVLYNLIEKNSVMALRGLDMLTPDPAAVKLYDELIHTWRSKGLQLQK